MRLRTLLVTTAVLAAAAADSATAQTTAPRTGARKGATVTSRSLVPSRSLHARNRTSRSVLPPPPPVPHRPSQRRPSTRRNSAALVGTETFGRADKSGRRVSFYAAVRGEVPTGVRQSAEPTPTASTPKENPAKNPFKILPSSGKN